MSRVIGIIGLGYVGLPLALTFIQNGYIVIGVDVDERKIRALNEQKSYLPDVPDDAVRESIVRKNLVATSDYSGLAEAEAVIICVPTPLTPDHVPDLSFLLQVAATLNRQLVPEQLIVLESSTYPGTTREVLLPLLEQSGMRVGEEIYLAYSPERINPGNPNAGFDKIPKVISGITDRCAERIFELYSSVFAHVVPVSSTEAAEMTKLLENTYRFVNISFINEFAMICDGLHIDVWEVIEAAKTKPYGFSPFYPGPGIGGHCIPVDPLYLQWRANQNGLNSRFIDYSHSVNLSMPKYIVDRIRDCLKGSIKGRSVLVIGAAYKRNLNDVRESSSLNLMELLVREGAILSYHDPYVSKISVCGNPLSGRELNAQTLAEADCVVMATDHSQLPIQFILDHANLVYDTRDMTRGRSGKAKIVRLGTGER